MRMLDKIQQFPRIEWKSVLDAPYGKIVYVLVDDGCCHFYTQLAWRNEFGEWVDIPHGHSVRQWAEAPTYLGEQPILDACCGGKMTDEKFKDLIQAPFKHTSDKVFARFAVHRTLRIVLQYPELAKRYFDTLPKAVQESKMPTSSNEEL